MSDLRFLIVNNHQPHSVVEKSKLDTRVSFPVYQDTEDRRIWDLMQGGKDDVFIYDKCGRLAYFIPFPLSIMNTEDALVPSAILATYFQSPCGTTCDDPSTPSFEESLRSLLLNDSTDSSDFTTPFYPSQNSSLEDGNSTTLVEESLDYLSSLEDETDVGRNDHNDLNFVLREEDRSNNDTEEVANVTTAVAFNVNRSNEIPMVESTSSNETENATVSSVTTTTQVSKKKSDRCAEADMSVCRTWSKRKLLRAQNCCNNGVLVGDSCRNYGKKRCKKIRTLLKCCLKTSYSPEAKTHNHHSDVTSKVNATLDDVTSEVNATLHDVTSEVNATLDDVRSEANGTLDDVRLNVNSTFDGASERLHPSGFFMKDTYTVCCKEVQCRISFEGTCDADERYIAWPPDVADDGEAKGRQTTPDVDDTTEFNYTVCCKEDTCRVLLEGACEADETVSQDDSRLQTN